MRDAGSLAARILTIGGIVSVVLMVVGLVAFAVRGGAGGETLGDLERQLANRVQARPAQTFVSVGAVVRGLAQRPVNPIAVIAAGVLLMLLTPVAGVAGALVAFLAVRDRRYATIAALLLLALLASFVFEGAG